MQFYIKCFMFLLGIATGALICALVQDFTT